MTYQNVALFQRVMQASNETDAIEQSKTHPENLYWWVNA